MDQGYALCLNTWALDKDIKSELGLLLIISSLCAEKGYCFASNQYLAELFDITDVSVSTKIKKLEQKNYISIEYEYRGCEVISRKIRLKNILIDDLKNFKSTIKENFKDKRISIKKDLLDNNKGEEVFDYYQQEIGQLTPRQYEVLNTYIDKLDPLLIIEGINIAVDNGAKTMNYLKAVLNNFIEKGYKYITDLETPVRTDKNRELEGNSTIDDTTMEELDNFMEDFYKN